jgi:capsular exopolysaccharide synthesis family protein
MDHPPALSNHLTLERLSEPESRQVFMGIYNNFLLATGDSRQKSLLICAANPEEGATTAAIGLALTVAGVQSWPVLLIDGNFANPQVCKAFEAPDLHGLGDLIAGTTDVKGIIQATTVPHLWIMGTGVAPLDHVSTLEPPYFKNLVEELSADYRLIIIDGPAINRFPESVLYAVQVDRVFLVVHASVTRVQVMSTALTRLNVAGCDQVDLILNRRVFPIPPWIYKRL